MPTSTAHGVSQMQHGIDSRPILPSSSGKR
jgi:hypothetical protein